MHELLMSFAIRRDGDDGWGESRMQRSMRSDQKGSPTASFSPGLFRIVLHFIYDHLGNAGNSTSHKSFFSTG
jgi:hypothetical protein